MEAKFAKSNFGDFWKHAGARLCEVEVAAYFAAILGRATVEWFQGRHAMDKAKKPPKPILQIWPT